MGDGSLHVDVLGLVLMMIVIMVMIVMIMYVLVAMVVTVIMMLMAVMIVSMRVAVIVLVLSLGESLEELVSRLHFIVDFDVTVANLGLQVQVAVLLDLNVFDVLDNHAVLVVVSMIMVVMLVTMSVIVAFRAVVMRAVTAVRLEHTGHVVEDTVTMATSAAAVTDDDEVNDVAHEGDDGGNEHDLSVEINFLAVNALVDAHNGFDDQPSD